MNRVRKEKLRDQLETLDIHEHSQVFDVIKRYTNEYTRTNTGALISSESLPDACIVEMERLVAFYLDQRKRMDADERARKSLGKE
uniref:NET domain-containing protein n=1 Tax=viral metagenome TaxID=1070528 RepID=A0A6C0AJ39_9ZZZZ